MNSEIQIVCFIFATADLFVFDSIRAGSLLDGMEPCSLCRNLLPKHLVARVTAPENPAQNGNVLAVTICTDCLEEHLERHAAYMRSSTRRQEPQDADVLLDFRIWLYHFLWPRSASLGNSQPADSEM